MTRTSPRVRGFSHDQRPTALSLDAAGTLVEVAEPVASTYARIARDHDIDLTAVDVSQRFARAFADAPPLAFGPVAPQRLDPLERQWWRGVVGQCLGLARDDLRLVPCFEALYAWFAQADAWRLYDDVLPTLEALREANVGVVVLSNFDSRLPGIASGLGLAARISALLYSTGIGYAKPDARAFTAAAEALEVPCHELLHVGDSRTADVAGARAAGCRALLLERAGDPAEDTISSLSTLLDDGTFRRAAGSSGGR